MVDVSQLSAEARDSGKQGALSTLRKNGKVPAIIYGGNKEPEQISLDVVALHREIERGGFSNRLFDVQTSGKTQRVLPREVQLHPVTDRPIHVDFLRLSPGSEVRLSVPVTFIGEDESPGIKRGGLINIVRHDVELYCRADSIPENLVANLDGLEIGDSIHISNISLPENVRPTITDRDFTIATIASPTVIQEDVAAEETEGEEADATEGTEGAESADTSAEGEKKAGTGE